MERRIGAMGTTLDMTIEAASRGEALQAGESAARAIEVVEGRISTWRVDSELSALNAAEVGVAVTLSSSLAHELAWAAHWARETGGAFDPAVGSLVSAWDLRGAGRVPSAADVDAALVPGGIMAALALDGSLAARLDARLRLEEGGFGKGAGLDAALQALVGTPADSAMLDFGGQVAWYERGPQSPERDDARHHVLNVADPRDRRRVIATLRTSHVSAATSCNSEHARTVGDRRIGHILDPRTGHPAPDFGSVTVLADRAIDADCLSTGLFVLGPDAALDFASRTPDIDVVVVDRASSGILRLRGSAGVADSLEIQAGDAFLETSSPRTDRSRTPR